MNESDLLTLAEQCPELLGWPTALAFVVACVVGLVGVAICAWTVMHLADVHPFKPGHE